MVDVAHQSTAVTCWRRSVARCRLVLRTRHGLVVPVRPPAEQGWLATAPAELHIHLDRGLGHRTAAVVAGRNDRVVGYADQFRALRNYPRATYSVLDAAGHYLPFEQPDVLKTLTQDWLHRCAT